MATGIHLHGGTPPPLVALHGFTGTGAMFGELARLLGRSIVAPDLPGHGDSTALESDPAVAVAGVASVLQQAGPPLPLLGYSMGGRIALLTALDHAGLIDRLILVSTSAGIEDPAVRERRSRSDTRLAESIREKGVDRFLDEWLARPMFAGLAGRAPAWRDADRRARRVNTAAGLAKALLGLGQGAMEPVWDRLGGLSMPVLVVAGEEDEQYAHIARRMASLIPHATVAVIPGSGHAVVGERPAELAAVLVAFLASQPSSQPVIDRT